MSSLVRLSGRFLKRKKRGQSLMNNCQGRDIREGLTSSIDLLMWDLSSLSADVLAATDCLEGNGSKCFRHSESDNSYKSLVVSLIAGGGWRSSSILRVWWGIRGFRIGNDLLYSFGVA